MTTRKNKSKIHRCACHCPRLPEHWFWLHFFLFWLCAGKLPGQMCFSIVSYLVLARVIFVVLCVPFYKRHCTVYRIMVSSADGTCVHCGTHTHPLQVQEMYEQRPQPDCVNSIKLICQRLFQIIFFVFPSHPMCWLLAYVYVHYVRVRLFFPLFFLYFHFA